MPASISTWPGTVPNYGADLAGVILSGLRELGVGRDEITGKRILLKPNLVDAHAQYPHIHTHPLVVRGAAEAFLKPGAAPILVGAGPANTRDTLQVVDQAGLAEVLREDRLPFLDLNHQDGYSGANLGEYSSLKKADLPHRSAGGGLGRFSGQDENAPLDRHQPLHEKSVRGDGTFYGGPNKVFPLAKT